MLTNCVPESQAPSTSDFLAKRSKLACLTRKISKTIKLNQKWLKNFLTNFSFRIRKDPTGHIGTLTSSSGKLQTGRRIHSASHALAILCSLSSQKITNDFKMLFTILCISYGAGSRFVGMLNHIGLTVTWQKAMQVLDNRMEKMTDHIKELTPTDIAIILLMDNINIYKGKRKHFKNF